MATDRTMLGTSALLEELANLRRYAPSIIAKHGRMSWAVRVEAIENDLHARGVAIPADPTPAAPAACRLRPLADHVVVAPVEAAAITEGGIHVPDSAKEKPMQGEVLAVGPGKVEPMIGTITPSVRPGDVVLYGRFSGIAVTLDERAVLIMREEDILGILKPLPEA